MKPDKHKQKKQNEYKKKHGIADKVKVDDKTRQTKSVNETRQDASPNSEMTVESNQLEAEQEPTVYSFKNYEDEFESCGDIEELETGEELGQILKDTHNILFQYQYHQNSFFEEIGNYSDISDKCVDIVLVQPSILSEMLLSLPLYKRLDLEEDIFEPSDLMKMNVEASKYLKTKTPESRPITISDTFQSKKIESMFASNEENVVQPKSINDNAPKEKPFVEKFAKIPNYDKPKIEIIPVSHKESNPMPIIKHNSKLVNEANKKTNIAQLEDELDALLQL